MGMGQDVDYSEFVLQIEKAVANGVASLDSNAKVPKNQIDLVASDVGAIATGGTAALANQLTTSRTIAATGDATYSVSFDGSANVSAALTLTTVNGNTGSFGSSSLIPAITVNSKGLITAVSTNSIGNELVAFQALPDTTGLVKKTGDGTYTLDANTYLTGNQSITVSGDASGTGTTAISLTLANSGVTAGTYNALATQNRPFTIDAKGRVTGVGTPVDITPPWSVITGKPTGLLVSDSTGISGASTITNIVQISRANYNLLTPVSTVLYLIIE